MSERTVSSKNEIVIIGGGIIGCTTAYYITRHPSFDPSTTTVRVVEASKHGVAQGASGKAGGLVAKWAYPKELVDISYPEHVKLAEEHNGTERWGWRFVGCGSWEGHGELINADANAGAEAVDRKSLEKTAGLPDGSAFSTSRRSKGLPDDLNWVKEELTEGYSPMAPPGDTAQVHPYLFTTSMMDLAKEKGAELIAAKATAIQQNAGRVSGVVYVDNETGDTVTIPATHVVLSAGAWSPSLLPKLPIEATRAHSIVIRPKDGVSIGPYVLFTEISLPSGEQVTPEIYARPENKVYACGPGDNSALPPTVDDVEVYKPACDSLWERVASVSQELREGTVEKEQACFLPTVSIGGGPIVGHASKTIKGLFIATGHTCWVRISCIAAQSCSCQKLLGYL
ncbi:hypothetical protein HGRIS_012490 [Hohenbuehelia grisea]|uniref:FAD dependent oxidoreductase domain-containing protein n=1 Tax=Hohenbuehelia grisea TaxID=104357 RepID=A0ABR3ISE8_9AGAR